MARKNFLIAVMVVSSLLLSSIVQAQSDADGQTRRVKGHILTSTSLPPIRIRFDKRFKYVGSQQFVLYDRAQVEQYFFVDADRQQYNISGSYNYPVTKTVSLAGQSYIADAEIVQNVAAAIKQDTKSDVARAASFLDSKGYQVGEGIAFQRFVRLVDEGKRREFILLYVEGLSEADLDAVEKEKAMKEFSGRALKGFKILE
jgi:hypothetical protein